jgi:hypothetical protein
MRKTIILGLAAVALAASGCARRARRWAFRSARARAAGGSAGPRSMFFIIRW